MKQQSITSLPVSPEAERRSRMIKYSVAMGIRVICIVLMLFVHGWWLLLCAIGAIALPYFAVIVANVHSSPNGAPVLRPGGLEIYRGDPSAHERTPDAQ
ncbi:DUF3099 domain-containing protein [Cryobacterium roopkundense]|uniref:Putative tellurium resistance membrane protein TerC n=1 Tax=Cryobacterium roopkundense TaxID=1001240 RepID=A0A7W8ZW61_9MICO|nr:DUF3099 domain-containing protein [Cryobacterium roopkundense]MBB5641277.1 putative tellurium resistance membrane protein TerC [Cryobacterium roopkundense]